MHSACGSSLMEARLLCAIDINSEYSKENSKGEELCEIVTKILKKHIYDNIYVFYFIK